MLIFWIGLIIYIVGAIGLLIDEFKESLLWGLLGLIFQVTHILFAILHFHECKKSLGTLLLGFLLMIVGIMLSGGRIAA
ncbi:MAG: hypothetical protein IKR13_02190 [Victivallales bacterium]|nr:hypothetical protein [Victivallales bacterium]